MWISLVLFCWNFSISWICKFVFLFCLGFFAIFGMSLFLGYSFSPALFPLWDANDASIGSSIGVPQVPRLLIYSLFVQSFFLCSDGEFYFSVLRSLNLSSVIATQLLPIQWFLFLISVIMFCQFYNFHLDLLYNFYVSAETTLSCLFFISSYNYLFVQNVYHVWVHAIISQPLTQY